MLVKIGYENLILVNLTRVQLADVEKIVGSKGELREVASGWAYKGAKAEMFDLLLGLSYKYDLEVQ